MKKALVGLVAAGGLVVWRTGSILGCVLTAAIVTAVLRAL